MKLFFVFSGQGAQSVGMGRDLYEKYATAGKYFDTADQVLGYSLSDVIFNGPAEKLTETRYCQSAIYTMSCACLGVFRELHPEAVPCAAAGPRIPPPRPRLRPRPLPRAPVCRVRASAGDVYYPSGKEFIKDIDEEKGMFITPIPGFFD